MASYTVGPMHDFGNVTLYLVLLIAMHWVYRMVRVLMAFRAFPKVEPVTNPRKPLELPMVTVFVPARNEQDNILACIESLLQQDYPRLQILVINDSSTDRTEAILQEMQIPRLLPNEPNTAARRRRSRIGYVNTPTPTPSGWTGKNFALHCALPLAAGSWFLFTDADTQHRPDSVSAALSHALEHRLRLLTLLPRYITGSLFDNLITPLAMWYFAYWFSMDRVNNPRSKACFANGQFLLVEADLYRELGGHEGVRNDFLEDFALMRRAKTRQVPVQCASGTSVYGTRMYDSLERNWRGWRRICVHAFAKNYWVILFRAAELFCASILPFLLFVPLTYLTFIDPQCYGVTWVILVLLQGYILALWWRLELILGARKVFFSLLHPFRALGMLGILIDAGYHAFDNRQTSWR